MFDDFLETARNVMSTMSPAAETILKSEREEGIPTTHSTMTAVLRSIFASYFPSAVLADVTLAIVVIVVGVWIFVSTARMTWGVGRDGAQFVKIFVTIGPRLLLVLVLSCVLYALSVFANDFYSLSREEQPEAHESVEVVVYRGLTIAQSALARVGSSLRYARANFLKK